MVVCDHNNAERNQTCLAHKRGATCVCTFSFLMLPFLGFFARPLLHPVAALRLTELVFQGSGHDDLCFPDTWLSLWSLGLHSVIFSSAEIRPKNDICIHICINGLRRMCISPPQFYLSHKHPKKCPFICISLQGTCYNHI